MGRYRENPFDGNYIEWQIAIQKIAYPDFSLFLKVEPSIIEIPPEEVALEINETHEIEVYSSSTVSSR